MTEGVGFADFVREYTPALLRTAYLLTGERAAAEDLVQDTFARLYPKWEMVAGADAPIAYVRRSLTNTFVDGRRRAASRELLSADPTSGPHERGEAGGPDDATRLAVRDELWDRLRQLPERQRAALVLRFYEDLADQDAADVLGCRVGTLRSLVSRGLAALRTQQAIESAGEAT